MRFIVDFHIHSHYSRATSKQLTPENLAVWARLKGIQVMGTGDCIHPGWCDELKTKLSPVGNGLYQLKSEYKIPNAPDIHPATPVVETQFLLTAELSCIYKKGGRVRKVHHLLVFPDFTAVENLQARLNQVGNIASDGRPILGLDSRHLLGMLLEADPRCYLIPAHIWTPWFSVLGSKSGFDTIEDCYGDLAATIFAVETGLSSDPPMNRVCSFLDNYRLVSNSDAHSLDKLGREANLFDCELSYEGIRKALQQDNGFLGTIEFFPQEGKYHYDGHRKCQIVYDPLETLAHQGRCPKCRKPLTLGVMYRVAELADRAVSAIPDFKQSFLSITPLTQLLAEVYQTKSITSKKVNQMYFQLLDALGSEFDILLHCELSAIRTVGGELISEGIDRLRQGRVHIEEGYDGEFGRITVFDPTEIRMHQTGHLFTGRPIDCHPNESVEFDIPAFQQLKAAQTVSVKPEACPPRAPVLTEEQVQAITFGTGPILVIAGPGSGKTRILTERIRHLIHTSTATPDALLAITFSNKAADEIRHRLTDLPALPLVTTFHKLGLLILTAHADEFGLTLPLGITDEAEQMIILTQHMGLKKREASLARIQIDRIKQGLVAPSKSESQLVNHYNLILRSYNRVDINDLIALPVQLFQDLPEAALPYHTRWPWVFVDEYQDINRMQYQLLIALTGKPEPNLFAIGDPDQAIYGFRGSDVRLIDQLKTDFPTLTTCRLSTSFRCPDRVLMAAGQVLGRTAFMSGRPDTLQIQIEAHPTDTSEAEWISQTISRLIGGTHTLSLTADPPVIHSFSDVAILCRTSHLFPAIKTALAKLGIPVQVSGEEGLWRTEPFITAIHYLKSELFGPAALTPLDAGLQQEVARLMHNQSSLLAIIKSLLDWETLDKNDQLRVEMISRDYGHHYARFLQDITLAKPADDHIPCEAVSLMSMHAAKGLEFEVVFIPGCETGIMPFELFHPKTPDELAEEERLFYVGITRTKSRLYLSHTNRRNIHHQMRHATVSTYITRLSEDLFQIHRHDEAKQQAQQLTLFQTK